MAWLISAINELHHWHWLVLGLVLLVLEVLGASGFLLGMAVAAISTGIIKWLFPELSWAWQLVLFGVLAVALSYLYWRRFRAINEATDHPTLNNRAARMVGRRAKVITPVVNGYGKVQIEDALWTVRADSDHDAGDMITITGEKDGELLAD